MAEWMEEQDPESASWRCQLRMDRILARTQTEYQDILLFVNPVYGRVLALDGIVQTTEADEFIYHEMLAHVPILSHGAAKRVLIIGGGDGGLLEEVLKHKQIEHVTLVEIDAGVVTFAQKHLTTICGGAFDDPRVNLVIADAAQWITTLTQMPDPIIFDIILQDSTDPVGPGAVLFTREFYEKCRQILAPDGIFSSQNTVPFLTPHFLRDPLAVLAKLHKSVLAYRACIPSFYGGETLFAWASNQTPPNDTKLLNDRAKQAGLTKLHYWTPKIQQAAFILPPLFQKWLPFSQKNQN